MAGRGRGRDTLHDFSLEYVKAVAEVFGWRVATSPGASPGPDVTVVQEPQGSEGRATVIFIESEVGHDVGRGAERYFRELAKRLRPLMEEYRRLYGPRVEFKIVVITNAPRRFTEYVRSGAPELHGLPGFKPVEGCNVFIVPVLMLREVMPAVFVRASSGGCA